MINRNTGRTAMALLTGLCLYGTAYAQMAKTSFPKMMPLDQYLMERKAEIALARSAAPASISADADVLILGRHGYESAAKGKNGFLCYVERAWHGDPDGPDFWDPRVRGPICLNPAAVRTVLPVTKKKTELALSGATKEQIVSRIKSSIEKKELPIPEVGAMCYMLSPKGWLAGADGHWHPHLMFYLSETADWGADLPESPVLAFKDQTDHLNLFMVPVKRWSDGTLDMPHGK